MREDERTQGYESTMGEIGLIDLRLPIAICTYYGLYANGPVTAAITTIYGI